MTTSSVQERAAMVAATVSTGSREWARILRTSVLPVRAREGDPDTVMCGRCPLDQQPGLTTSGISAAHALAAHVDVPSCDACGEGVGTEVKTLRVKVARGTALRGTQPDGSLTWVSGSFTVTPAWYSCWGCAQVWPPSDYVIQVRGPVVIDI
jgi:hypothetical protein